MKKTILFLMLPLITLAQADWAYKVRCEIQTAGSQTLPKIVMQQGTTPLFSFDQYRSGRAVKADGNATATLIFGKSATEQYYVQIPSHQATNNSFLIQCPTIGTNTVGETWWYTVYFEVDGYKYWTGNGELEILETTSTGDGLHWQDFVSGAGVTQGEMEIYVGQQTEGFIDTETDPVAAPIIAAHKKDKNNPHDVTPEQIGAVTPEQAGQIATGVVNIAIGELPPAEAETDPVAMPLIQSHAGNTNNPHDVTPEQIGAVTPEQAGQIATGVVNIAIGELPPAEAETDLAALRTYHYGSPDIVESPAEWFEFDSGTITGFNIAGGRENVVIPWAIGGVPVTAIGDSAFSFCESLTSITIPNSVTSIGYYAFEGCYSLTSITIPNSVTSIGYYAFEGCYSLTSVTIGNSVTSIGSSAFSFCESLTSITIPNSVTSIGSDAFSFCESLTSVTIGNSVTSIGSSAFSECRSLTSVTIGNSVTSIGSSAFLYCTALTSVTIPNSVTSIGYYTFEGCESLTSLYFDGNAPTIGADIFAEITANQVTNYVTNPTAIGWGDKLGDMPVVRLPLYADAIYQAGELVATTGHVAQAIAAIEFPVTSTNYTAWTGTITPADGTATVTIAHGNMPVLVTDAPCVLTLDPTGYGTAGVSRVSLSYYTGTNSFTFATNFIGYAETPTVDTNGWNTLLIRRVSNGAWKGVGL